VVQETRQRVPYHFRQQESQKIGQAGEESQGKGEKGTRQSQKETVGGSAESG